MGRIKLHPRFYILFVTCSLGYIYWAFNAPYEKVGVGVFDER